MATTITETRRDQSAVDAGGRTAVRTFHVLFDSATVGNAISARLTPGIPQYRDPHPDDPFLRVGTISAEPEGDTRLLYLVTVSYINTQRPDDPGDPLLKPAEVEFSGYTTREPLDEDINGDPIVNVNGEPFDPPLEADRGDLRMSVLKNFADYPAADAATSQNHVNSTTFSPWSWPAGTVKCIDVTARQIFTDGLMYWQVRGEFLIRYDGRMSTLGRSWWRRIRNEGFRVKNTSNGQIENAVDALGNLVTSPVLLDANGFQIAPGDPAHWLEKQIYYTRDLNVLGLFP